MSDAPRRFRYRAVAADGRVVAGELAAADRDAALQALRRRGELPLSLAAPSLLHWEPFGAKGLGAAGQAALFGGLATLLGNGVALDEALGLLAGPGEQPAVGRIAARLRERLREGSGLAGALEGLGERIDPATIAMIRAGEEGGRLGAAAARVAARLDAARRATEQARAALTYPALVLGAAALTVVLISTVVVPAFLPLFTDRGAAPPLPLSVLAALGGALASPWSGVAVLAALGALLLARRAFARPGPRLRLHRALLRLPRIGRLLAAIELGRFAGLLGGLIEAGVRLPAALALARAALRNAAVAADIAAAAGAVRAGGGLGAALAGTGLLAPIALHLLQVGERSGQLATALTRVAEQCEREVQRETARALALLGPALVVGLGGLVGFVVWALLGAVLDANSLVL